MKAGDRIKLLSMPEDPHPVPPGTLGTVVSVNPVDIGGGDRFTQIDVKWDNGRSIMLCTPPDRFEVVR